MIIVAVVSTKGGVGKTTATANLGSLLADLGMRVLLIDADVQPSLSRYFALAHTAPHGLTKLLMSQTASLDCISRIQLPPEDLDASRLPKLNPHGSLDIVLSDANNRELQMWLDDHPMRGTVFSNVLRSPVLADAYDIVLIDTQGAKGPLQDAAILAADFCISPICPDILSAREFISGTVDLHKRLEPARPAGGLPHLKAIIYKLKGTTDARMIADQIRTQFLDLKGRVHVIDTAVPDAVAYQKAATAQLPVHWVDPSKASAIMHRVVWELFPNLNGVYSTDFMEEETQAPEVNSLKAGAEDSDEERSQPSSRRAAATSSK